jgi:hypothetical protein
MKREEEQTHLQSPWLIKPKSSDSFDCCLVLAWEDENQPGFGVTAREKRFDRERQSE